MEEFQGWIPYESRDKESQKLTDEFHEQIGTFQTKGIFVQDIPKRFVWAEIEKFQLGHLLPRIWQRTGSCVGAGGWCAGNKTFFGDFLMGQTEEALKPYFPWAPYGYGRRLGGLNRRGSGSFGPVQAKAMSDEGVGLLPFDDERFPQPKVRDDFWWYWTADNELDWSTPRSWPVNESEMKRDGVKHGMQEWTKMESVDDIVQHTVQGRGITLASSFGSRNMRVQHGLLVATWNATWYHQMSYGGFAEDERGKRHHCIDNQWTKTAHPECPYLAKWGSNGSFWIDDDTMQRICDRGEVYGFANGGFTERNSFWEQVWTRYENGSGPQSAA